ncbi:conserved Plasmodium protein, unknown function [Plasmodium malariae]|uniref:Methyltransferase domain-containing protein n=1 Tax=Plasmodium malariae TaxID=5858 RepID=A0A1A8VZK9_PLAMA|nr:conserved Plasmodium protein, unknown function [Plasmodium malariae]
MSESKNIINIIENEINIYNEVEARFDILSSLPKNFNYNFKELVHLICKVKNVRKHGKLLFFCDTILKDNEKECKNIVFYKHQILNYNSKDDTSKNEDSYIYSGHNKYGSGFYFIKNTFNENARTRDSNIQLVISKDFYIDEEKFVLYQSYLLNNGHKEYKAENEEMLVKNSLFHSIHLCNQSYSILKELRENAQISTSRQDNINDDKNNISLILINEYIKHEIISKVIKTDSWIYIIGLPARTNTNEKSILVFSSYLLKVNYEYFNISELLKLFENSYFSTLTVCRSLQVKEDYIHNIYYDEERKKKYILNIVYKNKDYKSICNQKMNNFEIFIIKIIDIIPKVFTIHPSEFKCNMNDIQSSKNLLKYFNIDIFNDHLPNDNKKEEIIIEGQKKNKKKKKKKKKKDIMSYMNNKKVPQIHWMINHIKNLFKEIKKGNLNDPIFCHEDIILWSRHLVNKYIESNSIFFENYLEFLKLFIEKNDKLVNEKNIRKVENNIEVCTKKNVHIFENSSWSNIEFYNIRDLYLDNTTDTQIKENPNCKRSDEENINSNYFTSDICRVNYDEREYNNLEKEQNNNTYVLDEINYNFRQNNLTYDYCVLDVGGGKGDLGIYISLVFKNVLVIILDINVNSLFSCFIKVYTNKIKNVVIMHESILYFDFKKYKIDLIVGLHCCGGLTDYTLKKCINEKIPFLICSCCYTKYSELRKYIFDFKNNIIMNEVNNYIYNKNYYSCMNYITGDHVEDMCAPKYKSYTTTDMENSYRGITNFDTNNITDHTRNNYTDYPFSCSKERDHANLKGNSSTKGTYNCYHDNKLQYNPDINEDDNISEFNNYKKKYDKYGKKIMRRTIPNIYSFVNLLSKLCESENPTISFKCMHFYNNLRFKILQILFNATINLEEKVSLNLSLHSFPISFSPKNIVLKGFFS